MDRKSLSERKKNVGKVIIIIWTTTRIYRILEQEESQEAMISFPLLGGHRQGQKEKWGRLRLGCHTVRVQIFYSNPQISHLCLGAVTEFPINLLPQSYTKLPLWLLVKSIHVQRLLQLTILVANVVSHEASLHSRWSLTLHRSRSPPVVSHTPPTKKRASVLVWP